ncbi:MAG: bifunctional folylpolyglutamate synthase/dihydrofolate synthase [Chloroflexi bacterium]|nr:bifunctional folylpolyglutamate synthase/dihydrofolate synthase [Chloroflexota bacterium]
MSELRLKDPIPDALAYLYSHTDYASLHSYRYAPETFDPGRMHALMARLGDPQERYPAIHIAGTKGKGSVAALCAAALRAAGYRTGLYTSPHLQDFTERIQVDGVPIPPEAVAGLVSELRPHAESLPGITTFELTTALGFLYFARAGVQAAAIEVGLGGRLDATNILAQPAVTVITSLSLDHTHLLGNTLAQIAAEKAGILKPGVPLVLAPQPVEALARVAEIAAARGVPVTLIGNDWLLSAVDHSLDGQRFRLWRAPGAPAGDRDPGWVAAPWPGSGASAPDGLELEIPLLGEHQMENAAVAYVALQVAGERGLPLPEAAIRQGFKSVRWPGRFEILRRQPPLVVDSAHNRDSARKLHLALQEYFPARPVTLIFGASGDKDVAGMLDELLPHVRRAILTRANHPRACDPEELAQLAAGRGCPVEVCFPVSAALAHALEQAQPDELVLVTGSLFVVGEALNVR